MKRLRICVYLVTIFVCRGFACAQVPSNSEQALNEALVQYRVEIEDLSRSRGVDSAEIIKLSLDDDSYLLNGARPIAQDRNITRRDISKALANYTDSTAVLFYSYLGDRLRIWLIDKNGLVAYQISDTPRSDLNAAMVNLRSAMRVNQLQLDRAPHLRGSKRRFKRTRLRTSVRRRTLSLSVILVPPDIARGLSRVRHLIVAPVMGIGTVPFAMLRPPGDETYLIERMSISVVPSVYDVLSPIEKWNTDFQSPLIVGNPFFPPSKKWVVPQLPGAEEEAHFVGKAFNSRALTGKKATKTEIIEKAREADFLYFATHGIANSNEPLAGGFLLFSASELEQGWWTAQEIQRTRLKAKLTVLSACQTGLGSVHDAGVIGLSRAFQIAGVPRVAMSLWSVDDKATSQLMKSFVSYLRDNVPSEALRLAMLDLKKHHANPARWAAFVVFGTPR